MNKNLTYFGIAAAILGIFYLIFRTKKAPKLSADAQRKYLSDWAIGNSSKKNADYANAAFAKMNDDEINTVYIVIHDYFMQNKKPDLKSDLAVKFEAISTRYNIFT